MDELAWWQRGIIYEAYPRSFKDSNADGVGDLRGLIERLEYLTWLGVDAIWVPPVLRSPMVDHGYDISDYCQIDPIFGDMAAFDDLLSQAHARGLKLVFDFVANHTSDQHPWFLEARTSRQSPKRDWYIWREPGPDGGPPNNWLSNFGGPAWSWDETTGQYYLHSFAPAQPDLNYRNPDVEAAMHDVLRFWLDRGIDGVRVDAQSRLIKDARFRDNPWNPAYHSGLPPDEAQSAIYSRNRPEVHDVIARFRRRIDQRSGRLMIGEMYLPIADLVTFYGDRLGGVHLPTNFHLIERAWTAEAIAGLVHEYEMALPSGAWPNWALGNHDVLRVATRLGLQQARVAAMLLLTLRGTPFLYYGDEIGMEDQPLDPELVQDPREKTLPGQGLGRDPARSPMQWDASANAGFSAAKPWLPVAANYTEVNVAAQADDPRSMLALYRQLIQLRRNEPALQEGAWMALGVQEGAFLYMRVHRDRRIMVALNMTGEPRAIILRRRRLRGGRTLLSTHLDRTNELVGDELDLCGDEGVIVALPPP